MNESEKLVDVLRSSFTNHPKLDDVEEENEARELVEQYFAVDFLPEAEEYFQEAVKEIASI